jgi:hypothetical protein
MGPSNCSLTIASATSQPAFLASILSRGAIKAEQIQRSFFFGVLVIIYPECLRRQQDTNTVLKHLALAWRIIGRKAFVWF